SVAGLEAKGPANGAKHVFLITWVFPNVFTVTERGVKNFSVAVFLAPGDWVMTQHLFAVGMLVEDQQFMIFPIRVIVLHQVDFLLFHAVGFAQVFGGGMHGVLHETFNPRLSVMIYELTPKH